MLYFEEHKYYCFYGSSPDYDAQVYFDHHLLIDYSKYDLKAVTKWCKKNIDKWDWTIHHTIKRTDFKNIPKGQTYYGGTMEPFVVLSMEYLNDMLRFKLAFEGPKEST